MSAFGVSMKQTFETAAGAQLGQFAAYIDLMAKDPEVKDLYKDLPGSIKAGRTLKQFMLDDLENAAVFIYKDLDPKDRPIRFYKALLSLRNPQEKLTAREARQALNAKIREVKNSLGEGGGYRITPGFAGLYLGLPDDRREALATMFSNLISTLPDYSMSEAAYMARHQMVHYTEAFDDMIERTENKRKQLERDIISAAAAAGSEASAKRAANDSGSSARAKPSQPVDIDRLADKSIQDEHEAYVLKERKKQIDKRLKELGEKPDGKLAALSKKVEEAGMPPEALEMAREALERMEETSRKSPDYSGLKDYVSWFVSIPWNKMSSLNLDIASAEQILDEDHYGLEKVKQAITEYVAVQNRTQKPNGAILCLVGPPGIGKTSLGTSIARATGRQFVRLSLGGLNNEAQIRGYEPSYKSAMPGKIVQKMKEAGTSNPLMLLDEIDKLGHSESHGDPAAALLELLDPNQNKTFRDNYLGTGYDVSKVLFVATANYESKIPPALRDRMEIIRLPGYTFDEKLEIAKRHLIPRQMSNKALSSEQFSISDAGLNKLILEYTTEAGVRELEQQIDKLTRRTVLDLARGKTKGYAITPENLKEIAGPPKISLENIPDNDTIGLVNGLAYTSQGGCLLQIEAGASKGGNFEITATGDLGKHIKESIDVARGLIKSRGEQFGVKDAIEHVSINLNAPADSPKDGPSAGAAITLAILSTLLKVPVRREFAMTGKIGLNGQILPIGGVREKLQGALAAGATTVLIPKANEKDLADVPESIKSKLIIHAVSRIEEVLQFALVDNVLSKDAVYTAGPNGGGDSALKQAFKAPTAGAAQASDAAAGDTPSHNASTPVARPQLPGGCSPL